MFECPCCLDLNVSVSGTEGTGYGSSWLGLSCYWPSLAAFPTCFFFPESHVHWSTLIFMWTDFLKMALTNPTPHVLLTVCWTHLHGVGGGVCPPPLPWIFMRASGGTRQWNLMEVMLHDLQGWVTKGSDFCLSPSFGTLALSSQAQCWEEPSRSMRWGPHGEPAASANARCVSECPFSDSRPQTLWNRLSPSLLCPVQVPDASNSWT